jgi:phospholipase/carboxylesterase
MTGERWSVDQLGALADEWAAEREAFLSAVHAYVATPASPPVVDQGLSLDPAAYHREMAGIGEHLCHFLQTMDSTPWYTIQHRVAEHQRTLEAQHGATVLADIARLVAVQPPADATKLHEAARQALALVQHILQLYQGLQGKFDFPTVRFANRLASQIKYRLYPVRQFLPAMQRYWLLDHVDPAICDPTTAAPEGGIQRYEADGQRGAYTCYVPETYQAQRAWPLLLALHGGSGNDEDFLWTWLKYAKSRGYLLVSAKSFGPTWFPWDAPSLMFILDEVQARYQVDPSRLLLTGLSDGGSFSYEVGFAWPERFRGLAVVAGILRPHQRSEQASQLPVYVAHGAQDQLFPVAYIRMVVEKLREWGHTVTYHELAGFGHAYPPGENTAILDWFAGLCPASQPTLP